MNFNGLPAEVKNKIVTFMSAKTVTKLAQTSKENYYDLWDLVGTYTKSENDILPEVNCEPVDNDFIVPVKCAKPKSSIPEKCKICIRHSDPINWCEACYADYIEQETKLWNYYNDDDYLTGSYGELWFAHEY
jgi:hypothetical protein